MDIKKIAVLGSGTMGNGIAHVFALNGFEVILVDIREEFCQNALNAIQLNLDRQVKKGIVTPEIAEQTLKRIDTSISLEACENTDFIIEAVTEDIQIKKNVFALLNKICPKKNIFASNTSSISITTLGDSSLRPDKFVGMHFMNPVPVMKLVEVIRGISTSDETVKTVSDLADKLKKVPVEVNDYPGFVSNRILMPMINEAAFCLMEGVASRESIDTVLKLGMAHPMGGATGADRFNRPGCRPGDYADFIRRIQRCQISSLSLADKNGICWASGS